MRKFIFSVIVLFLIVIVPATAYCSNYVTVRVDGVEIAFPDAKPYINEDNRTMVPVRFVSEALGFNVEWDNDTRTVIITDIAREKYRLLMPIGSKTVTLNGQEKLMDTAAVILNSRTFVPVRFVSEYLGAFVSWDEKTRVVSIISNPGDDLYVGDDVFQRPDIADLVSIHRFDADTVNKRFKFKGDYYVNGERKSYTDYVMPEVVNPHINTQVYNMVKALIGEGGYVDVIPAFAPEEVEDQLSYLIVTYSKNEKYADNDHYAFKFVFFDTKPFNLYESWLGSRKEFAKKTIISLDLRKLWFGIHPENWVDPFYSEKLKNSLLSIFGKDIGIEIYSYILNKYQYARFNDINNVSETKYLNNIQIDFFIDTDATLHFFFSYRN